MSLSEELLKILVCPVTEGKLIYDREREELISLKAGLVYPIIDGIPMMLEDQALKLDQRRFEILSAKEEAEKSKKVSEDI